MGEPRELPAGTALFYGRHSCEGVWDMYRAVAGSGADAWLVDRPWAFFDEEEEVLLQSFGVGPDGKRLAVLACERGDCESGYSPPSDDAILALWSSEDGGSTWERWGEVPVVSWIWEVAEDDVALRSSSSRTPSRFWWFRSGAGITPPGEIDSAFIAAWRRSEVWPSAINLADGAILWSIARQALPDERDLFAHTDEQGAVVATYSWEGSEPLELVDHLGGERFVGLLGENVCGNHRATVLVDFETQHIRPIAGVQPDDVVRATQGHWGALLLFARPAPSPTEAAQPAVEYTELALGEPRYQPAGYALFSGLRGCLWNCGGYWFGIVRTVFDERTGTLVVENPLEALDDIGPYFSFDMSEGARRMAAARCAVGYCGGISEPSDDAEEELWVSDDGGETWTSWGALLPPSWIMRVTNDDVAVLEWEYTGIEQVRVRWIRSGKVFPRPSANESDWLSGWDGDAPTWGGPELPPIPTGLTGVADWFWQEIQTRRDGSSIWYARQHDQPLLLLAVMDEAGTVHEVYGWPEADHVPALVAMGDGVFAGYRVEGGDLIGTAHLNFLIDLSAQRVHPLLGLPDGEQGFAEPWVAIPLDGK